MKSFDRRDWLLMAALVMCIAAFVSVGMARSRDVEDHLALFVDVRHEIVSRYVETPDKEAIIHAAVNGMIDALEDPYSIFLTPEELDDLDNHVQDRFTGIGAEITIDDQLERLKIVTPLEDSPAWRSGVMAGDLVLEIDGESTDDLKNIRQAQKKLLGPADTQVTVRVRHESGEEETITITRAMINVKGVRGFRRDDENRWIYMLDEENRIGYAKIRQFTGRTAAELNEALEELARQEMRGLILDMRFNPGGLLQSAVDVCSLFLERGAEVVSIKGRKVPRKVEKARFQGPYRDVPLVVLANEASASAAEIVTGALTDNGRCQFVGMRTFGKGSVQHIRSLDGGRGAVKMTTAYYYLPSGRLIHRREKSEQWGVEPKDGYFVPMTPEQIATMTRVHLDNKVLRDLDAPLTPEWIEEHLADLQLAAAHRAILGKLDTDEWPVVGESGGPTLARENTRRLLQRRRDLLLETLEQVNGELAKLDDPEADDADEADEADASAADAAAPTDGVDAESSEPQLQVEPQP